MNVLRNAYSQLRNLPDELTRKAEFQNAKRALLASDELPAEDKRLLDKCSLAVHREDTMYNRGYAREYLSAGLSASHCIRAALRSAKQTGDVGTILDFPCGYGRVLRFLRAMFGQAEITGAETMTGALDFCCRNFAITPLLSSADFSRLSVPRKFDLIWCGSLITHIDEKMTLELLRFFNRHLSDRGVCIFTTHGPFAVEMIKDKTKTFNLSEKGEQELLRDFQNKGYGYADYRHQRGYGISASSRARIIELAKGVGAWEEVFYLEHGWDNLQDVFGFATPKGLAN